MLKLLLIYCSFVIACLVVVVAFMTATTYTQLVVAILLYPMFVYFALKVFPRKARSNPSKKSVTEVPPPVKSAEEAIPAYLNLNPETHPSLRGSEDHLGSRTTESKTGRQVEAAKRESVGISDIDKRAFLKLIGGTGLAFFLYSIFNKKAEGLFPGMAPAAPGLTLLKDTAGNKIDPAQSHPMDGYRISEIDESDISYFGYTNKDGAWFIMKGDTDTGSFRYARGDSNFPGNWTNRENLKYDYFSNIF